MAIGEKLPQFSGTGIENAKLRQMVESLQRQITELYLGTQTAAYAKVEAATYNVQINDRLIDVAYTATGAVTINLPAAASVNFGGRTRMYTVFDSGANASVNNITIDGNGSEQINGSATYVISSNRGKVTVFATPTGWGVIA